MVSVNLLGLNVLQDGFSFNDFDSLPNPSMYKKNCNFTITIENIMKVTYDCMVVGFTTTYIMYLCNRCLSPLTL